jgi:lipopolysaccharide transport system ATP-binding protein
MSETVIQVHSLSKQYRLGEVGTGTLSHDLKRWWYRVRGKEDPFLKVGEINDRTVSGTSEYVWALRDINFEVKQGDILGIIGRNGAGKSTLLKILSKTTAPTSGEIKIRGRTASLLEVGTGFHPELTGRENIFLNGAIMGMTKKEIAKKFDEIVDFAGVERYVDTPVKRYSSGMYVRLAFAVAAHLEPEILIVDEVLAVGDVEFQKKCLGKMKDVSAKEGRTVLFVSHNMNAIKNLCNSALFLEKGLVKQTGLLQDVIKNYLSLGTQNAEYASLIHYDELERIILREGNHEVLDITLISLEDEQGVNRADFTSQEKIFVRSRIRVKDHFIDFRIIAELFVSDVPLFLTQLSDLPFYQNILAPGEHEILLEIPANFLSEQEYSLRLQFYHIGRFNIIFENFFKLKVKYENPKYFSAAFENANLRPSLNWQLRSL